MALESLPKIAPALFSAEQDLIQIYNKKSDTVGTINASYIGGSTPPSGVSGAIQFSNGSAFASDAANLFWDDTNNRLGVGTNAPTEKITAQTSTAADGISLRDASNSLALIGKWFDSSGFFDLSQNGTPYTRIQASQSYINTPITFGSSSALSAMVGIKGSGSTSATTSLLVQNSAGTEVMRVRDDGFVLINNTLAFTSADYGSLGLYSAGVWNFNGGGINDTPRINWGGYTSLFPSLKRNGTAIDVRLADDSNYAQFNTGATFIKGSGSTSATTSLLVQNSAGTPALEVLDDSRVKLGNSSDFTVYSGVGVVARFAMNIGSTSLPTAQLQVKGSGSTSATSSLLVQNSSGDTAVLVKDDREFSTSGGNVSLRDGALFIGSNFLTTYGQSIGFFGAPVSSAIVEMQSTTKGVLFPRMTTTQINAIASPAEGLVAYNTTISHLCCYQAGAWVKLNHSPM